MESTSPELSSRHASYRFAVQVDESTAPVVGPWEHISVGLFGLCASFKGT